MFKNNPFILRSGWSAFAKRVTQVQTAFMWKAILNSATWVKCQRPSCYGKFWFQLKKSCSLCFLCGGLKMTQVERLLFIQEEIQCRQSKRFRCTPSHNEEGRRCRLCLMLFSSFYFVKMLLLRCKENTRYHEGECVHAPGHNIVSKKLPGTSPRGSEASTGFDEV